MSNFVFKHKPVLLKEIIEHIPLSFHTPSASEPCNSPALGPALPHKKWMLDATFGAGGHTQALLKLFPFLSVIAIDRDPSAISWGLKNIKPLFPEGALYLLQADFHQYQNLMHERFSGFMKGKGFDIIIVDLGVSSPQIDQAQRGFSFYKDGPLDMRMDSTQSFSASDIVNQWGEKELMDLFYSYGEIRRAGPVIKALLKERRRAPLKSTKQLSNLIVKAQGWRKKGSHPATNYFLALRLKVNNELEGLKKSLPEMIKSLTPGGRIFVLTFHSLEDRIVKNIFKKAHEGEGQNLTKKVIVPSREEIKKNPRSHSAHLRIFERQG